MSNFSKSSLQIPFAKGICRDDFEKLLTQRIPKSFRGGNKVSHTKVQNYSHTKGYSCKSSKKRDLQNLEAFERQVVHNAARDTNNLRKVMSDRGLRP